MKLDRLAVLALLAVVGCAKPVEPRAADSAVDTTQLSAAEVETDMPKVAKPQHAVAAEDDETKDFTRRERKPGGGFSGYK